MSMISIDVGKSFATTCLMHVVTVLAKQNHVEMNWINLNWIDSQQQQVLLKHSCVQLLHRDFFVIIYPFSN